jgi:biopolymer transport protein ExbD
MAHIAIRNRRSRRRISESVHDLQLTSLIDVMVVIVVFLLKSYATSTNSFTSLPGMQIPYSSSPDVPPESLQILITPEAITFENERVLEFVQNAESAGSSQASYLFKPSDLDEGNRRIVPLFDALSKARDRGELLRTKSPIRDAQGKPMPFEGVVAITADKRIQYDTIRKIMYTAAVAGYKIFRFTAMQREQ